MGVLLEVISIVARNDALERGYVRRRYPPEHIEAVRKRIRELFPEHRLD